MKDDQKTQLQEMRRERLSTLVSELGVGGQRRLAEALGIAADYVSRMLYPPGKKGKKGISGDMARKIEQFFSVQIGWLDGIEQAASSVSPKDLPLNSVSSIKVLPLLDWVLPLSHEQITKGKTVKYPAMVDCSSSAYWLEVRDDTMSGSVNINYPKGSLILVEPISYGRTELMSGDKVIAKKCDTDDLTFKIYVEDAGHKWLKGIMPGYPTLNGEDYILLGLVLGAWLR
jgi:SOS-response transcriptional repressor LexA